MFTLMLIIFLVIVIGEMRNLYVVGEPECFLCEDTGVIPGDEENEDMPCYYCNYHIND